MGRLTHGPCATGASPEDRPSSVEMLDPNLSQPHSSPCWRLGAPRGHWCLPPQRRGLQAAPSLGAAVTPEARAERVAEEPGREERTGGARSAGLSRVKGTCQKHMHGNRKAGEESLLKQEPALLLGGGAPAGQG